MSGSKNGLPDYEKPPIGEVVCGLVFEKIEHFKAPHLGLFWQKVRSGFPKCQHAPPLDFSPESPDLMRQLPLPRVWFINDEDNILIQLQNDRILFNWRRIKEDEPYPRYRTIIVNFKEVLKTFDDFLEEERLGTVKPIKCELSYINYIPKGEGWDTLDDIKELLPDLGWRPGVENKRFLPTPLVIGWNSVFPLETEETGRLNVSLEYATRRADRVPVLVLKLTAIGLGSDNTMGAVWDWFELAHKWIVCGFRDLTGTKVQEETWGKISDGRCIS